ncbi:hypothetical protein HAX54_000405 [Datura stramonium]|uniref:Uncharacterized protein n=1 Tax=Datura stramonium TaxID=4076 RepID=A0ABS8T1P8_DATST|nr:hypothetical protein [Datura stramonium]
MLNDESVRSLELEDGKPLVCWEILKLNPSYKPPAGYKPVPKEAKIPVPIKEHPGYNFIGLIFGPAHKQLEKETGAQAGDTYELEVFMQSMAYLLLVLYHHVGIVNYPVEVTSGENDSGAYEEMYVTYQLRYMKRLIFAITLIELWLPQFQ